MVAFDAEKVRIGILITGNEILLGKTIDTNGGFIAKQFESLGFDVVARVTCGDYESELLNALGYLATHCNTILMTGGLGPTSDDLTAPVVAKFFNTKCIFNAEAWRVCVDAFIKMGRTEIPETNKKQAQLPISCTVLDNAVGTAAGFLVSQELNGKNIEVFALPGVPFEMEQMFKKSVLPNFVDRSVKVAKKSWQVFMLGESKLQALVNEAEQALRDRFPNAHVSYQAHALSVTYSANLKSSDPTEVKIFEEYLCDVFEKSLVEKLGSRLIFSGPEKIVDYLQTEFLRRRLKLALAESCTGGAIAKEITSLSGCSGYFLGSAVTYSNEAKVSLLGVNTQSIATEGAVSRAVVAQMALGAKLKFGSSVSAATSGVAGPVGGTEGKPVGYVCFALCFDRSVAGASRVRLVDALAPFGFAVEDSPESCYLFSCEQKFGGRLREQIQARASQFILGALAVAAKEIGND